MKEIIKNGKLTRIEMTKEEAKKQFKPDLEVIKKRDAFLKHIKNTLDYQEQEDGIVILKI